MDSVQEQDRTEQAWIEEYIYENDLMDSYEFDPEHSVIHIHLRHGWKKHEDLVRNLNLFLAE